MRYKADITAGALKLPESRVIAGLLLRDVSQKEWRQAIYDNNILQRPQHPRTGHSQAI